jgi:hypothetical protein
MSPIHHYPAVNHSQRKSSHHNAALKASPHSRCPVLSCSIYSGKPKVKSFQPLGRCPARPSLPPARGPLPPLPLPPHFPSSPLTTLLTVSVKLNPPNNHSFPCRPHCITVPLCLFLLRLRSRLTLPSLPDALLKCSLDERGEWGCSETVGEAAGEPDGEITGAEFVRRVVG